MSIYNSDATSSSFSILGNNTPSSSSKSSRGSRGRSGRSSNLLNTTAAMGLNEVPDVVGLSRIAAINALVAEGFAYSISYTTTSATSENNDIVASQSMADFTVVLNVYQYVASQNYIARFPVSTTTYINIDTTVGEATAYIENYSSIMGDPPIARPYPDAFRVLFTGDSATWVGKKIVFTDTGTGLDNVELVIKPGGSSFGSAPLGIYLSFDVSLPIYMNYRPNSGFITVYNA